MSGRLNSEFKDRTKAFAASIIRLYVKLPKNREEVTVCGKQLLPQEHQSRPIHVKHRMQDRMLFRGEHRRHDGITFFGRQVPLAFIMAP
jgi:hypothetical protein